MENRLAEILEERGLKKKWLTEKAEISYSTIRALVEGSDPHLSLAYKIANALGMSVYDIWPNIKNKLTDNTSR